MCYCFSGIYAGRADFANQNEFVRAASRERGKDMASDYRVQDAPKVAETRRGMFDGLNYGDSLLNP